jgi:hypothetical protein
VLLTAVYVLVTCGRALLSSRRYLRWLGIRNLLGVAVAAAVRADELTSVWCVYGAFVSVLILVHFNRSGYPRRADLRARSTGGYATLDE